MASKKYISLTGILSGTPDIPGKQPGKYVYQKTKAGLGNIPGDKTRRQQCRRWVTGTPSSTAPQIANRARFRLGVIAWHALTPEQKETWRAPGRALHLNRFQAFMRSYMRAP